MDTVSKEVFENALDKIRELSKANAKLTQAVDDKDTELFESQELAASLLEALEEIQEAMKAPGIINTNWLRAHVDKAIKQAKEKRG